MSVHSYGILLYRQMGGCLQVLLVHPGGPFWTDRDAGAWSIPKGLPEKNEAPIATARREFREETGFAIDAARERISTGQAGFLDRLLAQLHDARV
jgi:predicted NUDIX family NTP pyrophosphohydrolase